MKAGDLAVMKLTGELVVATGKDDGHGNFYVRRAVMSDEGISHTTELVYPFELEDEEVHLRREAKSVVLKEKIRHEMMKEIQEAHGEDEPIEVVN